MNWESTLDIKQIHEIRCRTHLYFGVGAITKIDEILSNLLKKGISRLLIVTGKSSYKLCGAWGPVEAALAKHKISYKLYDSVTPNPTSHQVDEASQIGLSFKAQAVLGIGGGSPIDAAKSVAILLAYPEKNCKQLYTYEFAPEKAVPVIAINTTHGTGTEVDRFAVVSILESKFKPAIGYDCIYPLYAIDDPALMTKLPQEQTSFVSIDALNHVTEAATSIVASPYSILLAKETIRIVAHYLPLALKDAANLEARYWLLYASAMAGISFDNGLLHYTHALEHPLSAIKPELAHGKGLAMLLPSVLETIYINKADVLEDIYSPIVKNLSGETVAIRGRNFAKKVENWLFEMGVTDKLQDEGYKREDIDELTRLSLETPMLGTLISLAPVANPETLVKKIYTDSFLPLI